MSDTRALEQERLQLLRDWSASRPRSAQTAIGRSELGHDCDAYLWHRTHGTPDVNAEQYVLPALRGIAFHALLEDIMGAAGWKVEQSIDADGMPGHVDAWRGTVVEDAKTGDRDKAEALRLFGPDRAYRWQVHSYARALNAQGIPIDTVRIVVYATDLSEQIAVWEEPYAPAVAEEALARLEAIRGMDEPPRPGKDGSWCSKYCRFFDPDGAVGCPSRQPGSDLPPLDDPATLAAVRELVDARNAVREAKERRDAAAAQLDGVYGLADGYAVTQVTRDPSEVPDDEAIRGWYRAFNGSLPTKEKAGYTYVSVRRTRAAS